MQAGRQLPNILVIRVRFTSEYLCVSEQIAQKSVYRTGENARRKQLRKRIENQDTFPKYNQSVRPK